MASKGKGSLEQPVNGAMTQTKDEFLENNCSVWKITPASTPNHPAVFPTDIPERLIKFYTWTNSVVLDPCAGSGVTLNAATKLGRYSIGQLGV